METKQKYLVLSWHTHYPVVVRPSETFTTALQIQYRDQPFKKTRMNRIRSFLYRSPRFKVDYRMDFILGDAVLLGTCTDLSESGLRGTFSEDVPTGAEGLVTLYHDDPPFQVRAKVYSIRDDVARVRFNFTSDKERTTIGKLMKTLSTRARG